MMKRKGGAIPRLEAILKGIEGERAKYARRMAQIQGRNGKSGNGTGGQGKSMGELLEQLEALNIQKRELALRARITREMTQMEREAEVLEQQNTEMQEKLQQPLSLAVTTPTAGQDIRRGTRVNIVWQASGPVGERVRISLLKNGVLIKSISFGTPTGSGSFQWLVQSYSTGDDFQIAIQDPDSGIEAKSDLFKIIP